MKPLRLLLAGDVMTGRGIDQVLAHPGAPRLLESWVRDAREYVRLAEEASGPIPRGVPPGYVWGDALAAFQDPGVDARIVNLETAVTQSEQAWPGKGIHYRMHPLNIDCLVVARLDACTLANNHVLDWGHAGLRETLAVLAHAGLPAAGAGRDAQQARTPLAIARPAGGRLLLSAWAERGSGVPPEWAAAPARPGIALLEDLSLRSAGRLAGAVTKLRRDGDVVVVSLHWGGNWGFDLAPAHRAFAHRLIDLGAADVVHGHSSHHPLPVEVYRGRAILYGCGDLINDYEGIGAHGALRSDAACLYHLSLAAGGALQALEISPLRLRRFRLEQADEGTRSWLLDLFRREGAALGTTVEPLADGRFALRWA